MKRFFKSGVTDGKSAKYYLTGYSEEKENSPYA